MSGHAAAPASGNLAAAVSPLGPAEDLAAGLVCADDLPDGLVIADRHGRVMVFNQAASRLTGISPESALGHDVQQVLPLRDDEDRCWWTQTRPYQGLCTRTRHPERPLYLPDGTELLVSVGYVRDWCEDGTAAVGSVHEGHASETRDRWHHHPGAVRRLAITLRDAQQRSRGTQPGGSGLHRRS
jgi:PAS domain S-box-containing protein